MVVHTFDLRTRISSTAQKHSHKNWVRSRLPLISFAFSFVSFLFLDFGHICFPFEIAFWCVSNVSPYNTVVFFLSTGSMKCRGFLFHFLSLTLYGRCTIKAKQFTNKWVEKTIASLIYYPVSIVMSFTWCLPMPTKISFAPLPDWWPDPKLVIQKVIWSVRCMFRLHANLCVFGRILSDQIV